jgi:flagellar basal-body rod protein FlgB
MMKVAQTQMDHQTATSLYARGLGMIKTALGKR